MVLPLRGIRSSLRTSSLRALGPLALGSALLLAGGASEALSGTHPIVVSTWDTRASSVALEYQHGFMEYGGFNTVSYHANFSATSGVQSAQFGLYYVNFTRDEASATAQGIAASANAVFNIPVARRYENGLPLASIALSLGSAPTALVTGERNYVTIPVLAGFGVPVTPSKVITITPWFEFSPAVNLDTTIHPYEITEADRNRIIMNGMLTQADVEQLVSESLELETSFGVGARGGLDLALHVSDAFDFKANATLSSVGTAFSGNRVIYLGGGLVWRWDDIVPAVLPMEKRLLKEPCDAIEARFRSCPRSREWRTPEQLQGAAAPTPASDPAAAPAAVPAPSTNAMPPSGPAPAPAIEPTPAPAAPAPAPAAPSPATGFPTAP